MIRVCLRMTNLLFLKKVLNMGVKENKQRRKRLRLIWKQQAIKMLHIWREDKEDYWDKWRGLVT